MVYSVISREKALHILDEDSNSVCRLDEEMLQLVSFTDEACCSGCVFQLAAFGILPTYVLYQVASHIQKMYAELQIDWFSTFYQVEKNNYLGVAYRFKELLEESDPMEISIEHKRKHFAAFEASEPVENVDSILLKIVMMNIINFDVKIR